MLAMSVSVFHFTAFLLMFLLKVSCLCSNSGKDAFFSDRRGCDEYRLRFHSLDTSPPGFSVNRANDILLISNRMFNLIIRFQFHRSCAVYSLGEASC